MMESVMAKIACKLSLLVALSFILTLSPAWADGNELLKQCKEVERGNEFQHQQKAPPAASAIKEGYCWGFITATRDFSRMVTNALPSDLKSCVPEGVTNEQTLSVILKYFKENPQELHDDEQILILKALHKAFPCK
jgi:hypothetical protein